MILRTRYTETRRRRADFHSKHPDDIALLWLAINAFEACDELHPFEDHVTAESPPPPQSKA